MRYPFALLSAVFCFATPSFQLAAAAVQTEEALSLQLEPIEVFKELLSFYDQFGTEQYMIDEAITQQQHALQAAYFALLAQAPEELIIGVLFHDVGQLCQSQDAGKTHKLHGVHPERGGLWCEEHGFSKLICDWVSNHALVKLLLCEEEPDYYNHLSLASKDSYWVQRAKYDEPEHRHRKELLQSHPNLFSFKACRKCDDMAKIEGFTPYSFKDYQEMFCRVLSGEGRPAMSENWQQTIADWHGWMQQDRKGFYDYIVSSKLREGLFTR